MEQFICEKADLGALSRIRLGTHFISSGLIYLDSILSKENMPLVDYIFYRRTALCYISFSVN
jgi:hypothetical protein